jgi:acyl-homoserine-lactone acylase
MKTLICCLLLGFVTSCAAQTADAARWTAEAQRVTIARDDWGIAHVHGKTDADAVFGMIYAQCEDDFNRVETNYLTALGRTAEADGEGKVWQDLRQRLFIDPADLKKDYAASPAWLQKLTDAWADGINFYLAKHPEVRPKVIARFEPWMAFSFTEGSIGGDIERVDLKKLQAFYGRGVGAAAAVVKTNTEIPGFARNDGGGGVDGRDGVEGVSAGRDDGVEGTVEAAGDGEPRGSNGIAIAPSNTSGHHALLLINPHTSFFFRSELQMSSDEGLDAYGAVTWGQFFIYQGFNDRAGWMHTSSGVDAVDEFLETLTGDGTFRYKYGEQERPFTMKRIVIRYKSDKGPVDKVFTAYYSSHGPVTHEENGKWVTMKLMNIPVPALEQSYLRTKARNYAEYLKTMELQANSSNNTIFADASGNIAYWHGNFIPKRDTRFDYTKPVDGSDPATDWHGLMTVDEAPHLKDPKSGYVFNVNNAPWWGSGESSLKKSDFPAYVEMGTESERGLHAIRLLKDKKDFTLESLMTAAYDSYLPWFDQPIPALEKAWAALPAGDALKDGTGQQVAELRGWDHRWSASSQATSLAVYWGQSLQRALGPDARKTGMPVEQYAGTQATGEQLLNALKDASDRLTADFGTWKIAWGEINRFQRLTGDIVQPFNDAAPSIPVPFTSSVWGSLASFGARQYPGTKKWYGTSGNSFVAVVEFGDKVRAQAVTAGGESGHPDSPHFDDEAQRYAAGNLREVYFYPEQLKGHTERVYRPGE